MKSCTLSLSRRPRQVAKRQRRQKPSRKSSTDFVEEEEFALPPIGLLASLARGKVNRTMTSVLDMTDRLRAELPEMLREHKAVVAALKKLAAAAKREKKPVHARFAEKLMLHAKTEEEVLYPAAILVGEYLKLKLEI
jgi:hypothetical protein